MLKKILPWILAFCMLPVTAFGAVMNVEDAFSGATADSIAVSPDWTSGGSFRLEKAEGEETVVFEEADGFIARKELYLPESFRAAEKIELKELPEEARIFSVSNASGIAFTAVTVKNDKAYLPDGSVLCDVETERTYSVSMQVSIRENRAVSLSVRMDGKSAGCSLSSVAPFTAVGLLGGVKGSVSGFSLTSNGAVKDTQVAVGTEISNWGMGYSDADGTRYAAPVYYVTALGIMSPASETSFDTFSPVTKAEFTAAVVRALRMDQSMPSGQVFADVPAGHTFAKEIVMASQLGLVRGGGDGNFEPDNPVQGIEALTIAVRALGYDEIAKSKGGFPAGYTTAGANIGISVPLDETLNRGETASLIYQMLDADVAEQVSFGDESEYRVENGKNLLTQRYGLVKARGTVTGNERTSFDNLDVMYEEGRLEIDGNQFTTEIPYADRLLGYQVDYYYDRENKTDILILYPVKNRNKTTFIPAEDIQEYSDGAMIWRDPKTGKKQSMRVMSGASIVYNRKTVKPMRLTTELFKPVSGRIMLLDSDGDGSADMVSIESYRELVVNSVNEQQISDKYGAPLRLESGDRQINYDILFDGVPVGIDSLSEWDVITVLESADNNGSGLGSEDAETEPDGSDKYYELVAARSSISGTVTGYRSPSADERGAVEIDGMTYEVSPALLKDADMGSKFVIGAKSTFYFNALGRIAAVSGAVNTNSSYGYFIRAAVEEDELQTVIQLRLIDETGKMQEILTADKVNIDGSLFAAGQMANMFKTMQPQLVRYGCNADGRVNRLDTDWRGERESEASLTKVFEGTYMNSSQGEFYGMGKTDDNTKVFIVANKDNQDDPLHYAVVPITGLLMNDVSYTMKAYDREDIFSSIKALVVSEDEVLSKGKALSKMFFFDCISDAVDAEGNPVQKLVGYEGSAKKEYTLPEEIDFFAAGAACEGLKRGDVIRIVTNVNGQVMQVERMINADLSVLGNPLLKEGVYDNGGFAGFNRYVYGTVTGVRRDEFSFTAQNDTVETVHKSTGVGIVIYDADRDMMYSATEADISEDDKVFFRRRYSKVYEMLIYRSGSRTSGEVTQ